MMDIDIAVVEALCVLGSYPGMSGDTDQGAMEAHWGAPKSVHTKKNTHVMQYDWGTAMFEGKVLRQLTFELYSDEKKAVLSDMMKSFEPTMIDRVEGLCRYYSVAKHSAHLESVLYSTQDADGARVETVAVLFPKKECEDLSLTVDKKMIDALRSISCSTRSTVHDICIEAIERYIKEYNKK